ncbi:MAG TPA: zf-HC2 domain-containing protein, partial [Actinoallomurus sp.]|nr:zf-HC2 domain-containing protein [Actinoallomurus sp.]
MTTDVQHTDIAAYALGLLEEDDRRDFEAHLAQCTLCTEELGDFAGLAAVFAGVPPVTDEEDTAGGRVDDMLRRRRQAVRSRRRGTAVLGAAAGLVLLAGGAIAGALTAHDPADPMAKAMPGHSMSVDEVFTSGEKISAADA